MKSLNEGIFSDSLKKAKNIVNAVNTVLNGPDDNAPKFYRQGDIINRTVPNLLKGKILFVQKYTHICLAMHEKKRIKDG